MVNSSIVSLIATDGLQQHMYASSTEVAELCKPNGEWCLSSSECCSGWCNWLFRCEWR